MRSATLSLLRCPRTARPFEAEVLEGSDDRAEYGLLTSEAGVFPVLRGIPVLTTAGEAVVELVRRGRFDEATAQIAFKQRPSGRLMRTAAALEDAVPRRLSPLLSRLRGRDLRRDVDVLADADPMSVLRRYFLQGWPAMPDAYAYFLQRFAMPRHLVALSVAEATRRLPGPLLDIGCGAGHMTWSLGQLRPDASVVGLDVSFAELLVARRLLGEGADFVCADLRSLPFADDVFGAIFAFDVFSFVQDKSAAAREALRVVEDAGVVAITSVKDARRQHVYAGLPLTADAWVGLFSGADVEVYDDAEVVRRYLAREALPAPGCQATPTSPTISILASRAGLSRHVPEWRGWPHARGALAVNPLYRRDGRTLRLDVPAGAYAADNELLFDYMPRIAQLPPEASDGGPLRLGSDEVDDLVAELVVLALPLAYQDHALRDLDINGRSPSRACG